VNLHNARCNNKDNHSESLKSVKAL